MKQRRGFAAMSYPKRTAIARRGGMSVDPRNRSFFKDKALAKAAGKMGGEKSAALRAIKKFLKEEDNG
jgi:general stress protein YciG